MKLLRKIVEPPKAKPARCQMCNGSKGPHAWYESDNTEWGGGITLTLLRTGSCVACRGTGELSMKLADKRSAR